MSLAEYHKKRKFHSTPEPKGRELQNKGPLTFVIQRHEATRLHYDFRLELDGVLKSWAVPKGPSLNPEDKRMAVMVEDHPMEYANFEGIIPKGNYGAGTVMVWDTGVYSPLDAVERDEAEKILKAQLAKGHLTFVLLGKKLRGEFALVRSNKMGDDMWLLLKKGDEFTSTKDILKEDRSVLSDRTMAEIEKQAEKKKQIWYSKPKKLDLAGAPEAIMPHGIKPMLAQTTDKPFSKKNWIFEMKWDGYRAIAEIESGEVKLYSRNDQPFNGKYAPVIESLAKFPGNAVLDGEVVVVDDTGRPKFGWLQNYPGSEGQLRYYVFDIMHYEGYNLQKLPLFERKKILRKVLPPLPHIYYSDHIEEHGREFFEQAKKLKLEGIMAKNAKSTYTQGIRSENWLKIKTKMSIDAVIAGFTAPNGGRKYFGSLVLGRFIGKKLTYIGHVGGGFDDKLLESIHAKLTPLVREQCPFETKPETNAPVTWVKPVLSCEVSFAEWTQDKQLRQPIFENLLEQETVTRFSKEAPQKETSTEVAIGKQHVKLVNLNKIFWPTEKYTKGDLINYYREVAPVLLPHLVDRPQSLKRFPNGVTGKSFFQKDTDNLTADWLKRITIRSESTEKEVEYLLCQDEASLLYIINLGCIDLNPWNSRVDHLDNPDYLIIDLDPEETPFEKVVTTALEFRKLFEKLEIAAYPKTSGARGMHIYIPMGAEYSYEQTRKFAELLCLQVQSTIPDITSMVRSPEKRRGKVYMDYLQNSKGQTLASVYSVRPEPGATVSTPLEWNEITPKLHPSQFTMKNIVKRVEKQGDIFKPVIKKGIKMENVLRKLDELFA